MDSFIEYVDDNPKTIKCCKKCNEEWSWTDNTTEYKHRECLYIPLNIINNKIEICKRINNISIKGKYKLKDEININNIIDTIEWGSLDNKNLKGIESLLDLLINNINIWFDKLNFKSLQCFVSYMWDEESEFWNGYHISRLYHDYSNKYIEIINIFREYEPYKSKYTEDYTEFAKEKLMNEYPAQISRDIVYNKHIEFFKCNYEITYNEIEIIDVKNIKWGNNSYNNIFSLDTEKNMIYYNKLELDYKLLNWIEISNISFNYVSLNKSNYAIELLKDNIQYIKWSNLSLNTNDKAIELLKLNIDKIEWCNLSLNTNDKAIELLKENIQYINWCNLSLNTNDKAIELLKLNINKIDWSNLSLNTNYKAIELLKLNIDKINWNNLSLNQNASNILENNITEINWDNLSLNISDKASKLLEEFPLQINWDNLSLNISDKAIELLKINQHKINWDNLSLNISDNAIELLKINQNKINWDNLSLNINDKAIRLLEAYHKKHRNINNLSKNTNIQAVKLLEKYKEDINWAILSSQLYIFENIKYKYNDEIFNSLLK
jgi:uncharacterized lipoprotein YehR (DUF1307 family)